MTTKRKPLSFDEKKERMLKYFQEKKEVFDLSSIEKFSVKLGIVLPSVKEVLQDLVADGFVDSDKIGSGNFYWSLPSKIFLNISIKLDHTRNNIKSLIESKDKMLEQIEISQIGKKDTPERTKLLEQLQTRKQDYAQRNQNLEKYQQNDPDRLQLLRTQKKVLAKKTNLWTDNLYSLSQYLNRQFNINYQQIEEQYGIPSELDYA